MRGVLLVDVVILAVVLCRHLVSILQLDTHIDKYDIVCQCQTVNFNLVVTERQAIT